MSEPEITATEPDAPPTKTAKDAKTKDATEPDTNASTSWGFPRFAKDFPRDPELDALVTAYARGDYASVRDGAPKLAASTSDEAVKRAAHTLRERIEPDPTSKALFLIAAALLVVLTTWWIAHDGPEGSSSSAPKVAPKAQHVD